MASVYVTYIFCFHHCLSNLVYHKSLSAINANELQLRPSIKSSFLHCHAVISADVLNDPTELSNQITAPGILKIFGNEICEGAHYKSVLATTLSSAKELVKEALER